MEDLKYFTAKAMQGLLSNPEWMKEYKGEKYLMLLETISKTAIKIAKETLKQLENEK